jgi:hypothetical protein
MATSFSDGGNRSTWREPPTLGMQIYNSIFGADYIDNNIPMFEINGDGITKNRKMSAQS